jgi:hypothetical protein
MTAWKSLRRSVPEMFYQAYAAWPDIFILTTEIIDG